MSYRLHRVAGAVREVVSDAIANRLWDPRIHRLTTVTRVEVSADLQVAKVYLSILGSPAEAKRSLQGMSSARGAVQKMLARRLETRQCPELRFFLDEGLRLAQETFRRLEELKSESDGTHGGGDPETTESGQAHADDGEWKEVELNEGPSQRPDRMAGRVEPSEERPSGQ